MKKIIALILALAAILSLASCNRNKGYPPVKSTDEEARTVMTLSIDGDTYEVKYELYRTFFLTYKSQVDGGDSSVWQGANKDVYVERINELILNRITEIYAAFAVCERIGFDVYSKDVENKIKENVRISVEGGSYGSSTIGGYESYDDYLAALKASNMNYSVQALLFRYAIAVDAIDTHYIGTASSDDVDINLTEGAIKYTRDDVKAFYNSDECVRVLRSNFQKAIAYDPIEKAYTLKARFEEAAASAESLEDKEKAVAKAIIDNGFFSNPGEVKAGFVIGRYSLERGYYGDMTDAAFAISEGEVSDPIEVVMGLENSLYILYRTYKSDEHFDANYDEIKNAYLTNYVGKISHGVAEELKSSVSYTEHFVNLDHSQIRM